ncbi:DUF1707 and DUF4870 domain-containing protein [Allonocardiopsis opalescens]|uniref:Putative Tic20 family protein n=1 Tax=Allonocardiopsis opalescens TaxID=1144618 RepID=A0A2T0Q6Z6_9ACTN|nr:DUF1707 and DUF4870 domain-containing protein [Allonocardiopsis opalescens]PRX99597.1 putative Tic20 family protein [Allonocardiopsis opalescens]
MTRSSEGPSIDPLDLRITNDQREAVVDRLKDAYSVGQLDESELEERLSAAMAARTGRELRPLLDDLPAAPPPSAAAPRPAPAADSSLADAPMEDRLWAAGAHVSGYFTWFLGPLVALLVKGNTSPALRAHLVEALNFQLTWTIASLLMPIVGILTLGLGVLAWVLLLLIWMVLPLVGGVAAVAGGRMRYWPSWKFVR